ncbi:MAG: hypothetical protein LCH41_05775 [Armatimonadetes bacterium]|nr:hypothetical protein [Armatimonadota bacterium]
MKGLGFLLVGVAAGFVLANVLRKAQEERDRDADSLAESIDRQLGSLENQLAQA